MGINERFVVALASLSIVGCVSRGGSLGQIPLMWENQHATVHILDEQGNERLPLSGQNVLMVEGFSFSEGGMGVTPGMHRLWLSCPTVPGGIIVNDAIPSIEFKFEAGKHYDLRCVDGRPRVIERHSSVSEP